MAQFRINPAVIHEELHKVLDEAGFSMLDKGEEAEKSICYISGALDMANAIIKRYEGGNEK